MNFQPCQKHHISPGVQRSKGKSNRFSFAKKQIFMVKLKPYCSVPQGHHLQSEGHYPWMVKQMDRDSTKEKIKDMGRIGKLIFDSPLCSVTCCKICMSTKINLEIMLSFLVLQLTRIWQYSVLTIFQVHFF